MARRAKTPRFDQYRDFPNTLDYFAEPVAAKAAFAAGPFELEIGCGRGEFGLELARRHPDRRFVGVDIKSDRMWFGAKQAGQENLDNLWFLRATAADLTEIFLAGSLVAIWLTFPDPYPKDRQAKHRLTHPRFLAVYQRLLAPGGRLILKTDNDGLFDWSLEQFGSGDWRQIALSRDLHAETAEDSDARILTSYERRYLAQGKTIKYVELAKP